MQLLIPNLSYIMTQKNYFTTPNKTFLLAFDNWAHPKISNG